MAVLLICGVIVFTSKNFMSKDENANYNDANEYGYNYANDIEINNDTGHT